MPRTRPLGDTEPAVNWLKESTRPEALEARRTVNAWHSDFPDVDRTFARRVQSERNSEHVGAIDELYVHHLLRECSEDVRYEEGGRGPDFRAYRGGEPVLAVEVASLFLRQDWARERSAYGRIHDHLNARLRFTGHFLHVDVRELRQEAPLAALTAHARAFLDGLPARRQAGGQAIDLDMLPVTEFVRPGVRIRLMAIPAESDARSYDNPEARVVGAGTAIGGIVNAHARLKRVLEEKHPRRRGYGIPAGVPYVIAVANHELSCSKDEVMRAVRGVFWERGDTSPPYPVGPDDMGFFAPTWIKGEPYNTSASAVLVMTEPRPWHIESIHRLLLRNPFASVPIADDLLPGTERA